MGLLSRVSLILYAMTVKASAVDLEKRNPSSLLTKENNTRSFVNYVENGMRRQN